MQKFILTIYLAVLLLASVIGLIQYRKLDKASRIVVLYLGITFTVEAIAIGLSIFYKMNNLFLYHLYSPIQFLLLSWYFNYSEKTGKIRPAGWIIGLVGISLSIVNSLYLQPLEELNTYFIVLESFLIIGMSLFSFYKLLVSDSMYVHLIPKFWFSSIFLVFWSFTFFYWLIGAFLYRSLPDKVVWLNIMIWFISVITYSCLAGVFLSYNKMKHA